MIKLQSKYRWLVYLVILIVMIGSTRSLAEIGLKYYLTHQSERVAILAAELNREHFAADTTGNNTHYRRVQQLQRQLTLNYQSQVTRWALFLLKSSGLISDPLLKRELQLTCLDFLGNQGDKAQINLIINKQIEVEKKFAVFRPQWGDQQVSNQFLKHILDTTYNEEELVAAWRAGGQIGEVVGPDLLELVKLRNKMARQQGYANYFQQQLYLNEQSEAQLNAIFKQVDNLTRQPYQAYKQEMDQVLAERYSIPIQQLKPWHYQQIFLQQAPLTCEAKLDNYYEQTDVIKVVKRYFKDLGLSGDKIIAASDLKPRRQKYPYAYCIDIDRNKDIRILANLQNDSDSAQTLLHEMGHAVYDANIAPSLPWRLREPASIGLTEGVAMMFGDMYSDPDWLQRNLGLTVSESQSMAAVCRHTAQLNELIFCRWALVMYEFEKELYANPGSHLDRYWWQLVEHYQLITPPAETPPYIWAAKVHLATAPVYYYQYVLGRIIASQLGNGWHQELTAPHPKNQHFGVYLKECVFAPGARYPWVQILQGATGQKLEPRSLLKDWGNK